MATGVAAGWAEAQSAITVAPARMVAANVVVTGILRRDGPVLTKASVEAEDECKRLMLP
jgi:hypothetical protein